jgi:hypothetical protein
MDLFLMDLFFGTGLIILLKSYVRLRTDFKLYWPQSTGLK